MRAPRGSSAFSNTACSMRFWLSATPAAVPLLWHSSTSNPQFTIHRCSVESYLLFVSSAAYNCQICQKWTRGAELRSPSVVVSHATRRGAGGTGSGSPMGNGPPKQMKNYYGHAAVDLSGDKRVWAPEVRKSEPWRSLRNFKLVGYEDKDNFERTRVQYTSLGRNCYDRDRRTTRRDDVPEIDLSAHGTWLQGRGKGKGDKARWSVGHTQECRRQCSVSSK